MAVEKTPLHSVDGDGVISLSQDPDLVRILNEKTAIICGMADLLLEADGSLDEGVARAALGSIKRHAAGVRELFKQD